jgi:hypothetical protein
MCCPAVMYVKTICVALMCCMLNHMCCPDVLYVKTLCVTYCAAYVLKAGHSQIYADTKKSNILIRFLS